MPKSEQDWSWGYHGGRREMVVTLPKIVAEPLGRPVGVIRFTPQPCRTLESDEMELVAKEYGCRVLGGRFRFGLA